MYKLNSELSKIISLIIVQTPDKTLRFKNGKELCSYTFYESYTVESISACESQIKIVLKNNNQSLNTNWIGEEQVSFF